MTPGAMIGSLIFVLFVSIPYTQAKSVLDACADDPDCPVNGTCQDFGCFKRVCICTEGFMSSPDGTKCLRALQLGDDCTADDICKFGVCTAGQCACPPGTFQNSDRKRCVPNPLFDQHFSLLGDYCDASYVCYDALTQVCNTSKCTCKPGQKETSPDLYSALPSVKECVPEDLTIGELINETQCAEQPVDEIVPLGGDCLFDADCVTNATCSQTGCRKTCTCSSGTAPSADRSACLEVKALDETCDPESSVCVTVNSICYDNQCICDSSYVSVDSGLCKRVSNAPSAYQMSTLNQDCGGSVMCDEDLTCSTTTNKCTCADRFREATLEERIQYNLPGYCIFEEIKSTLTETELQALCEENDEPQSSSSSVEATQSSSVGPTSASIETTSSFEASSSSEVLSSSVNAASSSVEATSSSVGAESSSGGATSSSVAGASSSVDAASSSVEATSSSVGAPSSSVNAASSSVEATSSSVGATSSSVNAASSSVEATSSSVGATSSSVAGASSSVESASSSVEATSSSVESTSSSVETASSSAGSPSSSVKATSLSIEASSSSVEATSSMLSSLQATSSSSSMAATSSQLSSSSIASSTSSILLSSTSVDLLMSSTVSASQTQPLSTSASMMVTSSTPAQSSVLSTSSSSAISDLSSSVAVTTTQPETTPGAETTTIQITTTTPKLLVNDNCTNSSQCPDNADCKLVDCLTSKCICNANFKADHTYENCLTGAKLSEACSDMVTCSTPGSYCGTDGLCECGGETPDRSADNDFCMGVNTKEIGKPCTKDDDCFGLLSACTDGVCECTYGRNATQLEVDTEPDYWPALGQCRPSNKEIPEATETGTGVKEADCKPLGVGDDCTSDALCPGNSTCIDVKGDCSNKCWCDVGYAPNTDINPTRCIPVVPLGSPCVNGEQRCRGQGSLCKDGKCSCLSSSYKPSKYNRFCQPDIKYITVSLLGEECDAGKLKFCGIKAELYCNSSGLCDCKDGYTVAGKKDLDAKYMFLTQCRNSSLPAGSRSAVTCTSPVIPLVQEPDFTDEQELANGAQASTIFYIAVPTVLALCLLATAYTVIRLRRRRQLLKQLADDQVSVSDDRTGLSGIHIPRPAISLFRSDRKWTDFRPGFDNPTFGDN